MWRKETLALPSVPVPCHQAALHCKRQLLPFPRVNMSYWKETLQFWLCPQIQVHGTHLFVMQPLLQFLCLCTAVSRDSGRLHFPLRSKCKWISAIIPHLVVFVLHKSPSLCFMSKMIQQLGPKFKNKQRLLKGPLEGRKWTKAPFVKRENK